MTTMTASISSSFDVFHAENPQVYRILVRLARQWVSSTGRHSLGIGALYERARWEIAIATSDPDYKINNNFRAFYARLIMHRELDLVGLFELRTSEADEWLQNLIDAEENGYGGLW
jgi:hypothetical protein